MIGGQSGDHRPNDDRYPASVCRRFFDKKVSTDRLAIVGRMTPDDRATVGRYHDGVEPDPWVRDFIFV